MKYSSEKIGEIAGLIWKTLEGKNGLSIKEIEKESGENIVDIHLGMGWLFKEGKLKSEKVGRSIKIYLK